jgi:hypothetical protein
MTRAVRRFRVSVEFAAGRLAICLRMSWLVWAETSPPISVDSRTWRAMSWPVALGGGWLGRVVLSSVVRRASEYLVGSVRSVGLVCETVRGLSHEAESEDVGGVELLVRELAAGEGVGEVEPVDEGGRVHPVVGGDVVASGGKRVVEAHAHGVDGVDQRAGVGRVGRGGAEGGGEELHWGFDLVAEVFLELNSGD